HRPEVGFVVVVGSQADAGDEAGNDAYRERATAEAEAKDAVIVPVVAAAETIDVQDVALQANPEDSGEGRPPFERRGSNAVVVEGDLLFRLGEIERLKQPPDVGLEYLR